MAAIGHSLRIQVAIMNDVQARAGYMQTVERHGDKNHNIIVSGANVR